jgi:hypothetical protein
MLHYIHHVNAGDRHTLVGLLKHMMSLDASKVSSSVVFASVVFELFIHDVGCLAVLVVVLHSSQHVIGEGVLCVGLTGLTYQTLVMYDHIISGSLG